MTETGVNAGGGRRAPARLDGRQWVMLVILTAASFIVVLDFASVFIPLPSMQEDLGGTLDEVTWVIGAFVLTFAVFLLACVKLADLYGGRRLFLSGVAVFALASFACALAPSIEFLIGARVVLGIGAAMVESAVFALITTAFSRESRSLAFRVQGIAFVIGALVAPVLSGAITTGLSWEYIFWLNVLVGLVIIVAALRAVPASRAQRAPLDAPGLLFSGSGLFLLFFAIIEGARFGWGSAAILGSLAGAAALLILFVVAEFRAPDPLVDLRLLAGRRFAVGNALRWASEFASMGVYFALSHFMQVQLGYSALVTGLLLMSVVVGGIFVAPVTETLARRVDVRWLVIPGFLLVAGGTFWLAHVSPRTGWAFFIAPLAIAGAGFVAQEGPTVSARDTDVPAALSGAAWRVSYSTFLLGVGLGVAVVSGVVQGQLMANSRGGPTALADAVNAALLSCTAIALLGAVVAFFFSSDRACRTAAEESG